MISRSLRATTCRFANAAWAQNTIRFFQRPEAPPRVFSVGLEQRGIVQRAPVRPTESAHCPRHEQCSDLQQSRRLEWPQRIAGVTRVRLRPRLRSPCTTRKVEGWGRWHQGLPRTWSPESVHVWIRPRRLSRHSHTPGPPRGQARPSRRRRARTPHPTRHPSSSQLRTHRTCRFGLESQLYENAGRAPTIGPRLQTMPTAPDHTAGENIGSSRRRSTSPRSAFADQDSHVVGA